MNIDQQNNNSRVSFDKIDIDALSHIDLIDNDMSLCDNIHDISIIETEPIQKKSLSVFDVASYILSETGKISTIKLHKLVYYAQAWSLVWDETPLFEERIEAWANGPVIPSLFFKHQGLFYIDNIIMPFGNYRLLNDVERETVDAVIEFYGEKSAQWLVELSHSEDPWKNARAGLEPLEKSNREIKQGDIAQYYGSL